MVKVPSSFVPGVDMQAGAPAFMQAQSPQAMQSTAGQQIQQFGQGLASFGEGVNRYASALDDAANEATVRKLDMELYDEVVKEVDAFELTQFDQTRAEAPKVLDRIEQKRKQIMERAENQMQTDMLSSTLNRRVQSAVAAVERHTGKQTLEFNKVEASKRAASFFDSASRNIAGWKTIDDPNGENEYRDQVATAIKEVRAAHPGIPQFGPDGKTTAAWTAVLQNYTGKMVGQAVDRLVKDSSPGALEEARDYVEDSAKRGFITEETRQSLLGTMDNQIKERDAAIKASELLDQNPKWSEADIGLHFQEQVRNGLSPDIAERQQRRAAQLWKARSEKETQTRVQLVEWARGVLLQPAQQEGVPGGTVYNLSLRSPEEIVSILQQASPSQYAELEKRGLTRVAVADANGELYREDPRTTVILNNLISKGALKSQFSSRESLQDFLYFQQSKEQQARALAAWDAENGDGNKALELEFEDKLKGFYKGQTNKDPYVKENEAEYQVWRRSVQLAYANWQTQNRSASNPNPVASSEQLLGTIIPEAMSKVYIDDWGFDTEKTYGELLEERATNPGVFQMAYVPGAGGKPIYLKEMPVEVAGEVWKTYLAMGGGSPTITSIYQYWDSIGRPMSKDEMRKPSKPQQATPSMVAPQPVKRNFGF